MFEERQKISNGVKDNLFIVAAIILAGVMISGAIIYKDNGNINDVNTASITGSDNNDFRLAEDSDIFKGNSDAPVTIVEFSDFQCPFCAAFYQNTLPQIEEIYLKTGKAKLVFRDFPLPFHADAQKAAEVAECAGEQGKFWEMHNMIFDNQEAIGVADLKQNGKSLGLDIAALNDCLDSGKYADEVRRDMNDGSAAGVSGTPTFFINGEKLVGAQPFSVFEQIIERKLSETK